MTSLVRGDGASWSGIGANTIRVNNNGTWVSPIAIKVNDNGVWVDTGYVSAPNVPGTPYGVGAWTSTYSGITVGWSASASPPTPDYYIVRLYDYTGGGSALQTSGQISGTLQHTFSWPSYNTQYQIKVTAYLNGVPSTESAAFKIQTGSHDWVDTSNWGTEQSQTTHTITNTTSTYSTYASSKAVDGNDSTYWISSARSQEQNYPEDQRGTFFEGFNFTTIGGGTSKKLCKVKFLVGSKQWTYLGVRQSGGWVGSIHPENNAYLDSRDYVWPNTNYHTCMYHTLLSSANLVGGGANSWSGNPGDVGTRGYSYGTHDVEAYGYLLENILELSFCTTQYPYHLSTNYRGYCEGVIVTYKEWVVSGYWNDVANTTW